MDYNFDDKFNDKFNNKIDNNLDNNSPENIKNSISNSNISFDEKLKNNNILRNISNISDNINFGYPPFMAITQPIRPILILDLNGIIIYMCHLIDINDVDKCAKMKNFLLVYKDFDNNLFAIFYRPHIKEFLLELNNYYDIYVLSTLNRTQTDIFISTINHLLGTNVFKGIYLKFSNNKLKDLDILNHDTKSTVIIDINANVWRPEEEQNIILISIFRGPHDRNINNDLLIVKKCLLRIHKLFIDNQYQDIRNFIHSSVLSFDK